MGSQNEDVNPRLPTWSGDWSAFQAFEFRVSLELDGTRADDRPLLGPRIAKNLVGKAWEMIEEIDRAKLREKDGTEYLLKFLKDQRGRDHVDLMGDALHDMFSKPDVCRRDGEEFMEFLPRFRHYVKAVDQAFAGVQGAKAMPQEFYGWFLLNQCMKLEPSDVANIKAKAVNYGLENVVNAIKMMWSGGGLAQKDAERKRFKAIGKAYMQSEEIGASAIYGADGEPQTEETEDELDEDEARLEGLAAALVAEPENAELLIAFQEAKKKVQYKEARKLLTKSRTARDFYPVANRFTRERGRMREGGPQQATSGSGAGKVTKEFNGECMRCGKYGHKARDCPQRAGHVKYATEETGAALLVTSFETTVDEMPGCNFNDPMHEMIFNVNSAQKKCLGILDSGASESIVGAETLQDIAEEYERLGFQASEEIKVDRSLHKNFIFGNNQVSPALGLAKINIGLMGHEYVLEAHVVEGATPLLLSAKVMYEWGLQVDFKTGLAIFNDRKGEQVQLERAPSYHLLMPIDRFAGHPEMTRSESDGHPERSSRQARE